MKGLQNFERLLLVHGHWNYDRLARMVLYFFYKNAVSFYAMYGSVHRVSSLVSIF